MKNDPEKTELRGKINALSSILKIGHEAFEKSGIEGIAAHIVNTSRAIVPYVRSALLSVKDERIRIISISGQPEVNENSEYSENLKLLMRPFMRSDKILFLDEEALEEYRSSEGTRNAFNYFKSSSDREIVIVPLPQPGGKTQTAESFLWVLEIDKDKTDSIENFLILLSLHYREALWYNVRGSHAGHLLSLSGLKRKILSKKARIAIPLAILLILVFWRVNQSAVADFELTPLHENVQYAPYDGIIKDSVFNNGDKLKKDTPVICYNTEELLFQLSEAQKEYDEISAELDRVRQLSFSNNEDLSKVRLLALKKEKKKISIDRINWYLSKSEVKAAQNGILDIAEKSQLEGKAVRAGEKLFEILSPDDLIAQITLNEKDASVLGADVSVTLYLHTRPEFPIAGKIISTSPKPVFCENGQFCYIIKAELNKDTQGTICGMRGVARVKGRKISLGYYLFRNLILWWRKI
ncbi:MAG: hypothetical protein A2020_04045 [Lentisphaerae bacterium GWF2_45_14]|nr:MAG: hypothetical protein A2020_04045 [Lentisphaerae bacterium GWF2_45_14]